MLAFFLGLFSKPWWNGISGATGTIAMIASLITVRYSVRAVKTADEQSKEYLDRLDKQTARLTAALLRPEIRVLRSDRAFQAVDRERSRISGHGPQPDVWVALINVGLAVAQDIDIHWESKADEGLPPDRFSMLSPEFRFIPQNDIVVIAFKLSPDDHAIQAGFIDLKVYYSDLVGTRYCYHAKLRYSGSGNVAGLAEDSTEVIEQA